MHEKCTDFLWAGYYRYVKHVLISVHSVVFTLNIQHCYPLKGLAILHWSAERAQK